LREISAEPLPMNKLRFSSPQEERAIELVNSKLVNILKVSAEGGKSKIEGTTLDKKRLEKSTLIVDEDMRLRDATCSCWYFKQELGLLTKGPFGWNHHSLSGLKEGLKVGQGRKDLNWVRVEIKGKVLLNRKNWLGG